MVPRRQYRRVHINFGSHDCDLFGILSRQAQRQQRNCSIHEHYLSGTRWIQYTIWLVKIHVYSTDSIWLRTSIAIFCRVYIYFTGMKSPLISHSINLIKAAHTCINSIHSSVFDFLEAIGRPRSSTSVFASPKKSTSFASRFILIDFICWLTFTKRINTTSIRIFGLGLDLRKNGP